MREDRECPGCGCREFGQGKLAGHAALMPKGKVFTSGSPIIADVCTRCGLIVSLKAEKPEKFQPKND